MSFLTPLFFWSGLLAIPIVLLYMLRLRRQERLVSSTWLWQRLVRDREANAPWQKLRRNLLLLVQLLILALLVLALARPYLPAGRLANGSVVVLLDASASMQATDVAPNRFAVAQQIVRQMIDDLGGGDQMTLILVGRTPQVLVSATADPAQLRQALTDAAPGQGEADWEAAYALAAGAAQGFRDAQIVVVSDGGASASAALLPVPPQYAPVGVSDVNLGLATLATHTTAQETTLLARVVNYGSQTQTAVLSLRLDDALFDARRLTLAPGESASPIWQLPPAEAGTFENAPIEASLTSDGPDYLALDNVAWVALTEPLRSRVLLVTAGNLFLEQVLGVMPGMELFKATPETPLESGYDLYVFDGALWPDPAPPGPLLIIDPPASQPPLTVGALFSNTITTRLADSPLLQFVDWDGVSIRQAHEVQAPWAQTLIGAEGGPLALTGEWQGRRVAVLTFDLRDSDLPLQIAFPILMANLTTWLNPGRLLAGEGSLTPGQPVALQPWAGATDVRVVRPDGVAWEQPVTGSSLIFDDTMQTGVYTLWVRDAVGERPAGVFTVNLFSDLESRIAPAATLLVGASGAVVPAQPQVGQQELWPWLLGLALAALVGEWWLHQRGVIWPRWSRRPK